jgi:hypothetical protein
LICGTGRDSGTSSSSSISLILPKNYFKTRYSNGRVMLLSLANDDNFYAILVDQKFALCKKQHLNELKALVSKTLNLHQ